MLDTKKIISQLLLWDAWVAAVVDDRIWGVNKSDYSKIASPFILYHRIGFRTNYVWKRSEFWQISCRGSTSIGVEQAVNAIVTLFNRMKNQTTPDGTVKYSFIEGQSVETYDEETKLIGVHIQFAFIFNDQNF